LSWLFGSKKDRDRERMARIREQGNSGEWRFRMVHTGEEIQRTGRGSDYRTRKADILGRGYGPWTYHEVKTGNSRLSEHQEKEKKKRKGHYRVERYGSWY
jgi:hypothetical protein